MTAFHKLPILVGQILRMDSEFASRFTFLLKLIPACHSGPYNTMQLRQKKAAETIQNADSYVWYAQSKYWSWKCQKTMGPAVDETDDEKRLGNRGVQVPPESGTDGQSKRIKL